jgi:hypothetical protein
MAGVFSETGEGVGVLFAASVGGDVAGKAVDMGVGAGPGEGLAQAAREIVHTSRRVADL